MTMPLDLDDCDFDLDDSGYESDDSDFGWDDWDDLEPLQPELDAAQLQTVYAVPVVKAEQRAGDWLLDWNLVRNLWSVGAYFVIVLAGSRFWCLPDPVIREISQGIGEDPWLGLDRYGQFYGRTGSAHLTVFQDRNPREVMAFLAEAYTQKGEKRKRGPDWGWKPD